jgi:branched-chain amino acid aminotransferase
MKIFLNQKIVDEKEAFISVKDRGYLFGEGAFETLRSFDGKIPFLDKHLNRLEWSTTFIGIPFPHPETIRKAIRDLLEANRLKDARIKIVLTGCGEHFTPTPSAEENTVNLMIMAEKLAESKNDEGCELTVLRSVINDAPPISNIKSVSWITKLIAIREITEKSCDDGILLNHLGQVTETTRANIFWVRNENLYTPPISCGLLGGITRQIIIDVAKDNGIIVKEQTIHPDELKSVQEVFLTNSVVGIEPVIQINESTLGDGQPGKTTKQLQELYAERIQEELTEE